MFLDFCSICFLFLILFSLTLSIVMHQNTLNVKTSVAINLILIRFSFIVIALRPNAKKTKCSVASKQKCKKHYSAE